MLLPIHPAIAQNKFPESESRPGKQSLRPANIQICRNSYDSRIETSVVNRVTVTRHWKKITPHLQDRAFACTGIVEKNFSIDTATRHNNFIGDADHIHTSGVADGEPRALGHERLACRAIRVERKEPRIGYPIQLALVAQQVGDSEHGYDRGACLG